MRKKNDKSKKNLKNIELFHLAKFVEERGGWKGMTKATIKGVLSDLPVVGKVIEEVVFNSKSDVVLEEMNSNLAECERKLQKMSSAVQVASCLIELADRMLIIADVKNDERKKMISSALQQLSILRKN